MALLIESPSPDLFSSAKFLEARRQSQKFSEKRILNILGNPNNSTWQWIQTHNNQATPIQCSFPHNQEKIGAMPRECPQDVLDSWSNYRVIDHLYNYIAY